MVRFLESDYCRIEISKLIQNGIALHLNPAQGPPVSDLIGLIQNNAGFVTLLAAIVATFAVAMVGAVVVARARGARIASRRGAGEPVAQGASGLNTNKGPLGFVGRIKLIIPKFIKRLIGLPKQILLQKPTRTYNARSPPTEKIKGGLFVFKILPKLSSLIQSSTKNLREKIINLTQLQGLRATVKVFVVLAAIGLGLALMGKIGAAGDISFAFVEAIFGFNNTKDKLQKMIRNFVAAKAAAKFKERVVKRAKGETLRRAYPGRSEEEYIRIAEEELREELRKEQDIDAQSSDCYLAQKEIRDTLRILAAKVIDINGEMLTEKALEIKKIVKEIKKSSLSDEEKAGLLRELGGEDLSQEVIDELLGIGRLDNQEIIDRLRKVEAMAKDAKEEAKDAKEEAKEKKADSILIEEETRRVMEEAEAKGRHMFWNQALLIAIDRLHKAGKITLKEIKNCISGLEGEPEFRKTVEERLKELEKKENREWNLDDYIKIYNEERGKLSEEERKRIPDLTVLRASLEEVGEFLVSHSNEIGNIRILTNDGSHGVGIFDAKKGDKWFIKIIEFGNTAGDKERKGFRWTDLSEFADKSGKIIIVTDKKYKEIFKEEVSEEERKKSKTRFAGRDSGGNSGSGAGTATGVGGLMGGTGGDGTNGSATLSGTGGSANPGQKNKIIIVVLADALFRAWFNYFRAWFKYLVKSYLDGNGHLGNGYLGNGKESALPEEDSLLLGIITIVLGNFCNNGTGNIAKSTGKLNINDILKGIGLNSGASRVVTIDNYIKYTDLIRLLQLIRGSPEAVILVVIPESRPFDLPKLFITLPDFEYLAINKEELREELRELIEKIINKTTTSNKQNERLNSAGAVHKDSIGELNSLMNELVNRLTSLIAASLVTNANTATAKNKLAGAKVNIEVNIIKVSNIPLSDRVIVVVVAGNNKERAFPPVRLPRLPRIITVTSTAAQVYL